MSTTFSPVRSRPAPMSCATWCRPPRRRWTSRSRRISSGCCSTPMQRDAGAIRAMMALARAVAPLRAVGACAGAYPRAVFGRSRRRGRSRGDDPHGQARDRQFHRSAYRGRHRGGGKGNARPGGADGGAVDRACRQISRSRRGGLRRRGRRCPIGYPISKHVRSASRRCRQINPRSSVSSSRRAVPRRKERQHEC